MSPDSFEMMAFMRCDPIVCDQVGPARCGTSSAVNTPTVSMRSTSRSRSLFEFLQLVAEVGHVFLVDDHFSPVLDEEIARLRTDVAQE